MAIAESSSISSKVVRDYFGLKIVQRFEADSSQHSTLFENTADDQKAALIDDGAKALEHVGHDDEIRKACLVFERDKDDIVRRHRPLPNDHRTGDRHDLTGS